MANIIFSGPVTIVHTGQDLKTLHHNPALTVVPTPGPSSLSRLLARMRIIS